MARDSFPAGVAEQLKWYVYRLIDPRNGETFYVGKGQGDRVFSHANGLLAGDGWKVSDPKHERSRDINAADLEVGHIIPRHGIDSSRAAYEVEAALIDAYPGLTNKARGHGTRDYGSRHVEEIMDECVGQEFEVREPLLLISVGVSYDWLGNGYEAVRYAWKINRGRVDRYNLVLANLRGMIVGAYRPTKWLLATFDNFPERKGMEGFTEAPDRLGFVGDDAEPEIWDYYVRKRVPGKYRRKGSQNRNSSDLGGSEQLTAGGERI